MPVVEPVSATNFSSPWETLEILKAFGFSLHLIPVGICLVGVPLALVLWFSRGANARRLAQRLFLQTPILLAFGILLGGVPLLLTQLLYSQAFYTSTILSAASWFGAFGLVASALAGAFFCARNADRGKKWSTILSAFGVALALCGAGLLFSNVWTAFERPESWIEAWRDSATFGGDATGTFLLGRDSILCLKFAAFFGLAFYAVAFWIVFDAFCLYRGPRTLTEEEELAELEAEAQESESNDSADAAENDAADGKKRKKRLRRRRRVALIRENPDAYRVWVVSAACCVAFFGLAIAAPTLGDYFLSKLKSNAPSNGSFWNAFVWATLASLMIPFVFLVLGKLKKIDGKTLAFSLLFCEATTVGLFATTRQLVQNARLATFRAARPVQALSAAPSTSFLAFLAIAVVVAATIVWLIVSTSNIGKVRSEKRKKPKKIAKSKSERDEEIVEKGRDAKTNAAESRSSLKKETLKKETQDDESIRSNHENFDGTRKRRR